MGCASFSSAPTSGVDLRAPVERGPGCAALTADEQILRDRQIRKELQLLVNHANALGNGVARGRKAGRLAVEPQLARCRLLYAREDIHQRRLAGAVFADERAHHASVEAHVDGIERSRAWKNLGNPPRLERHHRSGGFAPRTPCTRSRSGSLAWAVTASFTGTISSVCVDGDTGTAPTNATSAPDTQAGRRLQHRGDDPVVQRAGDGRELELIDEVCEADEIERVAHRRAANDRTDLNGRLAVFRPRQRLSGRGRPATFDRHQPLSPSLSRTWRARRRWRAPA